jgi:cytochrome P450
MITHIADALDSWRVGERRDVMNTMVALSLGVVTEALFGEDASEAADDLHHMLHLMQSAMAVEFDQPHAAHARSEGFAHDRQVAIDKIDRRIYALIERRRAAGSGGSDLLAMLLNARDDGQVGGMSDQQVRDEIITLFIAGHETTSTTLTWAFWLLGNHPSVYEALLAEVDAHIGSEAPTAARLAALQLPVQIVRETLRLYPTAWLLFNRLASKAAQVHDVAIAADEIVMLSPYLIQRDARYFDDPDAFMPSRFQEGWDRGREKFTYFPFGGGARVCIGQHFALMEASFMLAMVAQRFRFRLTQPQQAVTPLPLTVLQPNVPIEIEVVGR